MARNFLAFSIKKWKLTDYSQVSMLKTNCTKPKAAFNLTIGNQTHSLIPLTQPWPPNSNHATHRIMSLACVPKMVPNIAVNQNKTNLLATELNKLKNKYTMGIGRVANCTARVKLYSRASMRWRECGMKGC